jgi:hypothetical protein
MEPVSDARRLGDYLLKEQLSEGPPAYIWAAEQISVGREVLVYELRADCDDQRAAFLADARAKASVDHPLIASVYEAVDRPKTCFCAIERITGTTFTQRREERRLFIPIHLVAYLGRISEAQLQLESKGINTEPLTLDDLHLDSHGGLRMDNPALAGARAPDATRRDIIELGKSLPRLVSSNRPGSNRVLTLLAWMRGKGITEPLDWSKIGEYCKKIETQLSTPPTPVLAEKKPNVLPRVVALVAVLAVGLAAVVFVTKQPDAPTPAGRPPLPELVVVPAGVDTLPDGTGDPILAFRISAHEITISQYAAFLDTLDLLAKSRKETVFDDRNQPPEKTSHVPDDWEVLLSTATAGGSWQNQPVTLDSPVVGVDWWDATAYARWKQGRLPTQEEWFAALHHGGTVPTDVVVGPWQPVTAETVDLTPGGMIGMAGSVAEWTRLPSPDPANPLGPRLYVIIGGSHVRPASGALTREWTDDRSLRRADLGFRVVFNPDRYASAPN